MIKRKNKTKELCKKYYQNKKLKRKNLYNLCRYFLTL